jgi:hypothetical protein
MTIGDLADIETDKGGKISTPLSGQQLQGRIKVEILT